MEITVKEQLLLRYILTELKPLLHHYDILEANIVEGRLSIVLFDDELETLNNLISSL